MSESLKDIGLAEMMKKSSPTVDHPDGQKVIDNPSPTTAAEAMVAKRSEKEPSAKEAEEIRSQKKARLTQVLSRGILNSKLELIYNVSTPAGRSGKFVRADDESIIRYKNLGFSFDYTPESVKAHASSDGRIRVGDVVLMTISQEDREILREVKQDQLVKKLGAARKEYTKRAEEAAPGGVIPFDESVTTIN